MPPQGEDWTNNNNATAVDTSGAVDAMMNGKCPPPDDVDYSHPDDPPPMPWFGMDIGGTLAKLVYFEPTDGKTGIPKVVVVIPQWSLLQLQSVPVGRYKSLSLFTAFYDE